MSTTTETIDIIINSAGGKQAAADVREVGTAATGTGANMENLSQNTKHSKDALKEHSHTAGESVEVMNRLKETLVALGLAMGVHEWIELTDTWVGMNNALIQVTHSSAEFKEVQKQIFEISQATHSSLETNTLLFKSMAQATRDAGVSSGQVLGIIKALDQSMLLAGKSSDEVNGALRRMALAFQTGSFAGRGLQTIMLQMPELSQLLAHSFFSGADAVGRFRTAVQNGSISSKEIVSALIALGGGARQMGEEVDKGNIVVQNAFQRSHQVVSVMEGDLTQLDITQKKLEVTVVQAWQNMKNAILKYQGGIEDAFGASSKLAETIEFLAEHANIVLPIIGALAAGIGVYAAVATGAAAVTFLWSLAAAPLALAIGGVVAAIVLFISFADQWKLNMEGTISVMGVLVGTIKYLWDGLKLIYDFVVGSFISAWDYLKEAFGTTGLAAKALRLEFDIVKRALQPLGDAIDWVIDKFNKLIDLIPGARFVVDTVSKAFGVLKDVASNSLGKLSDDIKKASADVDDLAKKGKDLGHVFEETGTQVVNAFDTANAGVAKMPPAIGKVDSATKTLAATTSTTMKENTKWWDTWATQAEHDADLVSAAADKAASAARQAALPAGGTGTPLGGFQVYSPLASSRSNAEDRIQEAQSRLDLLRAQDTAKGITADAVADALAKAIEVATAKVKVEDVLTNGKRDVTNHGLKRAYDGIGSDLPRFAGGGSFFINGQGGVDSNLVQFMGTAGEKVTVQTPEQQRSGGFGNGSSYQIHMPVQISTPDANSFRRSEPQVMTTLIGKIRQAQQRIGGLA